MRYYLTDLIKYNANNVNKKLKKIQLLLRGGQLFIILRPSFGIRPAKGQIINTCINLYSPSP
jgi:hypothetical protein